MKANVGDYIFLGILSRQGFVRWVDNMGTVQFEMHGFCSTKIVKKINCTKKVPINL